MDRDDLRGNLTSQQTRAVWEAYDKSGHPAGLEYDLWARELAEKLGLPEKEVRKVCSRADEAYLNELASAYTTHAQRQAHVLGATLTQSISTLADCLEATKKRPFTDHKGRLVLDEVTGEPQWIITEDWPTRKAAAVDMIRLHGGFPAEKVEINQRTMIYDVTEHEATNELARLRASIDRLSEHLGSPKPPVAGIEAARGAAESVDSGKEPLLLADGMHGDVRRTGPAEPDQAVPRQDVPANGHGLPRKRAKPNKGHQKEPNHDGVVVGDGLGGAQGLQSASDEGSHPES